MVFAGSEIVFEALSKSSNNINCPYCHVINSFFHNWCYSYFLRFCEYKTFE